MRLVSDQSEEDMRRRETREGLNRPLRELTANLLRIALAMLDAKPVGRWS